MGDCVKILTTIWENEIRVHYPVTLIKTVISKGKVKYEYHTNFDNLLEYNGFLTSC